MLWIGGLILREPFCAVTAGLVMLAGVGIPVALSVADWKRGRSSK